MTETYLIYIYILIFAAFFAYVAQYGKDTFQRMCGRVLCFMVLFVPAALRYGIGADYYSYLGLYKNKFPYYLQNIEPGFVFIGKLCYAIGLSPEMFIAVVAGITYAIICFHISRKHIFIVVTFYVLSFLYLNSYSMIRQSLATSLLLSGFSLFYSNRRVKGILLFVAASLIHYSSLIAIPIMAISLIRMNIYLRFCLMVTVGLIGTNENILSMLIDIATLINPRNMVLSLLLVKTKINFGITYLIYMLPAILVLFNSKKILRQNNGMFILNANAIFLVIMVIGFYLAIIGRFTQALFFIPLFSIPILYSANKKYANLYHLLLILCFCSLFIRYIEYNSVGYNIADGIGYGISPYRSIFSK